MRLEGSTVGTEGQQGAVSSGAEGSRDHKGRVRDANGQGASLEHHVSWDLWWGLLPEEIQLQLMAEDH